MSQVLIISDSHFLRKEQLKQFIHSIQDVDAIIHCGDIYIGYQENDFDNLFICKGNNDFADIPKILNFTIDNVRFTITHGHINSYAYNPITLTELQENYPSDIICFGHTHVPYIHHEENLTILNPGSLTLARTYPRINTYVLYDTMTKIATFYNVKTHEEVQVNKS